MDSDKPESQNEQPTEQQPVDQTDHQAPADALSRTPDDLEEEAAANPENTTPTNQPTEKKPSGIKSFFKRANVYFLIFLLVVVVVAAITVVNYLNSQKEDPTANITAKPLTQEALKQLANTDATVGNTNQTLTIQGNTIIAGQTLARGNLDVAGNLQTGGSFTTPNVTVSGTANLGTAQANTLQVASSAAIQGAMTTRDLTVAGVSSFSGPMTASQITVTNLILSGNATLQVPNHIRFTGASPGRSINATGLGNGGSASVDGSDTAGTVNINTGNNPQAGCLVQINFGQTFSRQPHVIISPVGAAAGQMQYYVNRSTSNFNICSANAAPANQAFAFDYFVTN